MTLIRPDGTEGGTHDLRPGENKLGRSFGAVFENDGYLSPIHAQLDIRAGGAMVHDLDSLNGVFVKMTQEEELTSGQIIRIGQEDNEPRCLVEGVRRAVSREVQLHFHRVVVGGGIGRL